jgi:biopolymer transport protein TolR
MGMSMAQGGGGRGGRRRRGMPRYKAMADINMTPFIDVMLVLLIAIDEKGAIFVMDEPVTMDQLVDKLKDAAKDGFDERIYVRGSDEVNYGKIAEVMSLITTAGYKKVALVTEPAKTQ